MDEQLTFILIDTYILMGMLWHWWRHAWVTWQVMPPHWSGLLKDCIDYVLLCKHAIKHVHFGHVDTCSKIFVCVCGELL